MNNSRALGSARLIHWFSLLLLVSAAVTGCESRRFSHEPPPGQGSVVIDNRSDDILHVYLEGYATNDVSRNDYEIYDLDPGVYRVVLDERSGYRTFRDYIDVLDGQLTIMEVRVGYSSTEYDVRIYFD